MFKFDEIPGVITIDLTLSDCWNQPENIPAVLSACSLKYILNRERSNDLSLERIRSQQTSLL